MTNEELLKDDVPDSLLTHLDKQRRFVLKLEVAPKPCPACKTMQNVFEASGVAINDYDFGNTPMTYRCINKDCGKELKHCVPFWGTPSWLWEVK